MSHWTLAVMNASAHDPPEVIRLATVMGFVYVADVDAERRRLKILAPMPGRLSDRPLVWGGCRSRTSTCWASSCVSAPFLFYVTAASNQLHGLASGGRAIRRRMGWTGHMHGLR